VSIDNSNYLAGERVKFLVTIYKDGSGSVAHNGKYQTFGGITGFRLSEFVFLVLNNVKVGGTFRSPKLDIKDVRYFPKALSESDCIALTAL
jgi:hypothetical protein